MNIWSSMSLQNQGLFTIYSIQTNFFIVSSSWRSVKEDGSNSSSDKFQTCYTLKGKIQYLISRTIQEFLGKLN